MNIKPSFLLAFIVCIAWFSQIVYPYSQSCGLPTSEIDGLYALYISTNGSLWQWKSESLYGYQWNFTNAYQQPVCGSGSVKSWQGIVCSCNGNSGHIISINVASYGLRGPLPSYFPYPYLIALNLEKNEITGTISTALKDLTSLLELSLYHNSLHGPIPSDIGNMLNLTYLSLYSNHLSNSIPSSFSNLVGLQSLYLHSNHLTGTIPKHLGLLTNLRDLWLYSNRLRGSLPSSLGDLRSITKLYINHNAITGTIPSTFEALTNLKGLDLAVNLLSGELPYFLLSYPKLYSLSIATNCFTGKFPEGICDNPSAGKDLTIIIMDGLSSNPNCPSNLWWNDNKPWFIHGFLQSDTLKGSLPSCMWTLPNLTTLHVSANALQGQVEPIAIDSPLADVAISHNLFGGDIPISVQRHQFSTRFDVSSNRLTGTLISDYQVSNSQQILQLAVNRISGMLPSTLLEIGSNMTVLNVLVGNRFQCDDRNMPQQDPYKNQYSCGSNDLNTSAYSWVGFLSLVIFGALIFVYLNSRSYDEACHDSLKSLSKRTATIASMSTDDNRSISQSSNQSMISFIRYQWKVFLDSGSHSVKYLLCWWHETSLVSLSSYEDSSSTGICKIPQTILFLEFIRIIGFWSTITIIFAMTVILPFDVISNLTGYAFLSQTYGYVISSVFIHGNIAVIFFALVITMLLFKIKLDSNYHRVKAITYLAQRSIFVNIKINQYWVAVVASTLIASKKSKDRLMVDETPIMNPLHTIDPSIASNDPTNCHHGDSLAPQAFNKDGSIPGNQDNGSMMPESSPNEISEGSTMPDGEDVPQLFIPAPIKPTLQGFLLVCILQVFNIFVTALVNVLYVNALERSDLTDWTILLLQIWIGCFKFLWSMTYIPIAVKVMINKCGKSPIIAMSHRYLMLIVNFLLSPCIATIISNQSPFSDLTAKFSDTVNNYAYDESTGSIAVQSVTVQSFQSSFSPPFLYSFSCGSALLVAYIPVLLYSYSISGMVLPVIRLLLLRMPSLRKYIIPYFLRDLHNNTLLSKNDGRVVLDGKATIITLMVHLTVLLTFGLTYPMLAFAVVFTIVAETATHKLTMGKFLYITKIFERRKRLSVHGDSSIDVDQTASHSDEAIDERNKTSKDRIQSLSSEKSYSTKSRHDTTSSDIEMTTNIDKMMERGQESSHRKDEDLEDDNIEEDIVKDFEFDNRLTMGGSDYATKVLEESNRDAWTGIHASIWYFIFTVCWFWGLLFFDMIADENLDIYRGIEAVIVFAVLVPLTIFLVDRVRYHPRFVIASHRLRGIWNRSRRMLPWHSTTSTNADIENQNPSSDLRDSPSIYQISSKTMDSSGQTINQEFHNDRDDQVISPIIPTDVANSNSSKDLKDSKQSQPSDQRSNSPTPSPSPNIRRGSLPRERKVSIVDFPYGTTLIQDINVSPVTPNVRASVRSVSPTPRPISLPVPKDQTDSTTL